MLLKLMKLRELMGHSSWPLGLLASWPLGLVSTLSGSMRVARLKRPGTGTLALQGLGLQLCYDEQNGFAKISASLPTLTWIVRPMFCIALNILTQYPLRPFSGHQGREPRL